MSTSEGLIGWQARPQWDALVRGDGCPTCAEIHNGATDEGFVVARLKLSQLRLQQNQFVPGYAVLVCTRHVAEPFQLTAEEHALFFQDLVRAMAALDRVFAPIKMNVNLLGNLVPHLHAHLLPRYVDDPAPGRPIDPNIGLVTLTPDEYEECVRTIQAAL